MFVLECVHACVSVCVQVLISLSDQRSEEHIKVKKNKRMSK